MSKDFKVVFTIRFLGYFIFLVGIFELYLILGPVVSSEFSYRRDKILGVKRSVDQNQQPNVTFGTLDTKEEPIIPVDTNFGIVVEKINANAPVIANVDPSNEKEYTKALMQGVAHAKGTNYPGEPGNIYLFSHSTNAPWNIVRYNAIFYLLRELEVGDKVIMFYGGRRYDYIVFDKQIAKPTDITFLTNKYESSVLTLQTCDPPGLLINRLIIRARLASS